MSPTTARAIRYDRLLTPEGHLDTLIEPPPPLDDLLASGAIHDETPILDTTLGQLRSRLAERLGLSGPRIVTGHQAEFFHAGVFAKIIAADVLAAVTGGQAVFLIVDSDLPKTGQLLVPQVTPGGTLRVELAIPGCDLQQPFELHRLGPREHWFQFFARAASLHSFYDQSLLRPFAHGWLTASRDASAYCAAMAAGLGAAEEALGLGGTRRIFLSDLCATPEFRVFLAHVLSNAAGCATSYNAALGEYRRRHRVRAAGRPVPPLRVDERGIEVPFWISQAGQPRRRLFVAQKGGEVELLADGVLVGGLSIVQTRRAASHADAWPVERGGWRIRPRALALTAFARLCLADLFIHGIGGAQYDEVMEDYATRLFGVAPRPACCVTATLRLPLPHSDVGLADIAEARRQSRDLRFNPQRHLTDAPADLLRQRTDLVRQSEELRMRQPGDRAARRLTFRELRRINERLLETDPWRAAHYDERVRALEEQRQLGLVATDREYFFALHPRAALIELVDRIRGQIGAGRG